MHSVSPVDMELLQQHPEAMQEDLAQQQQRHVFQRLPDWVSLPSNSSTGCAAALQLNNSIWGSCGSMRQRSSTGDRFEGHEGAAAGSAVPLLYGHQTQRTPLQRPRWLAASKQQPHSVSSRHLVMQEQAKEASTRSSHWYRKQQQQQQQQQQHNKQQPSGFLRPLCFLCVPTGADVSCRGVTDASGADRQSPRWLQVNCRRP